MEIGKRYAIIVGVSEYEDEIAGLPNTTDDVMRLRSALQDKCSFSADRVYLLTNGIDKSANGNLDLPTRANVLQKLQYVCNSAGPDDLILLYFAGHGAEISKTPYLLVSDTKMDVLHQTALCVNTINEMLEASKAKCVVRFFDACRSTFAEGRSISGRMTRGFEEALLKLATGWASFSSCSSGETAFDSPEFNQGVFTYYLCQGLAGSASNSEGNVTLESLVDYVKTSVTNWCDRQTLRQTPHFQSDISGSLVFSVSTRSSVESTSTQTNPFAELFLGLDEHLSRSAGDTRRLTFTSEDEFDAIATTVFDCLKEQLDHLSHSALTPSITEGKQIHVLDGRSWKLLQRDMNDCGVHGEYASQTIAFRIDFCSQEVLVPSTALYVGLIRFKFFYWIWYQHVCPQRQLQGNFTPDPALTKGFFTFKSTGIRDTLKVKRSLSELFSRVSHDIVIWAKQLGAYVESRVDPLRKVGSIIE